MASRSEPDYWYPFSAATSLSSGSITSKRTSLYHPALHLAIDVDFSSVRGAGVMQWRSLALSHLAHHVARCLPTTQERRLRPPRLERTTLRRSSSSSADPL